MRAPRNGYCEPVRCSDAAAATVAAKRAQLEARAETASLRSDASHSAVEHAKEHLDSLEAGQRDVASLRNTAWIKTQIASTEKELARLKRQHSAEERRSTALKARVAQIKQTSDEDVTLGEAGQEPQVQRYRVDRTMGLLDGMASSTQEHAVDSKLVEVIVC